MGYRLSRIYTRTGDRGETGLGDGSRRSKDDPRLTAIGEVDELNSTIGLLRATGLPEPIDALMERIQHRLFDLGGELSIPGGGRFPDDAADDLEAALDELNATVEPLKEFILPGGCEVAARCHLARSVCRRAERALVTLQRTETVDPALLRYINRLSDLLFVTARWLNQRSDHPETLWRHP